MFFFAFNCFIACYYFSREHLVSQGWTAGLSGRTTQAMNPLPTYASNWAGAYLWLFKSKFCFQRS